MDISQLLVTLGSLLGILMIGALAVVPPLIESDHGRPRSRPDQTRPVVGDSHAPTP